MSDLTFNKIAGALLATGLAIVGLREISSGVFTPNPPAKPGFQVDISAELAGAAAPKADVPPDWGTVLPKADVAAGQATFAKCQACHSLTANGIGPDLFGVVGRHPGSEPGFAYSDAMKAFGQKQPIWDYDHLYEFIKGPQAYINGTKMTFVGLKKPEDRINVIAFLHSQGSKLPIPPPNPKAAEAAAGTTGPAGAAAPGAAKANAPTATNSTAGAGSTPGAAAGGPSGQGPGAVNSTTSSQANPGAGKSTSSK
jgi:cytochrome c